MSGSNIWEAVLSRIETKVNRHSFYTWFKPTSFVSEDGSSLRVRVPNTLFRDWLTKHYSAVLDEALAEVDRKGTPVAFVTDDSLVARRASGRRRAGRVGRAAGAATASRTRTTRSAVLRRAIPSTRSSSDRRISLPTRRAARSPRRRRAPTIRCSSTAVWDSARRT